MPDHLIRVLSPSYAPRVDDETVGGAYLQPGPHSACSCQVPRGTSRLEALLHKLPHENRLAPDNRRAATNERISLPKFEELGLSGALLRAITAEGYTIPTPIQVQTIPAVQSGHDILGTAQTGTGKTAAFILPLLDRIAALDAPPPAKGCRTLVLAPTRELAAQIADSIRTYGRFVRHSRAVVVGGVRPAPQIRAMAKGVDILVATPGRLLDHLSAGHIRLDGTTSLVIDEADQMLDLGFMPAIRRILKALPESRQTILLSATMPPVIRALAAAFLRAPREISVAPAARPIERIEQTVLHVDSAAKRDVLVDLLKAQNVTRAIVFTRTKRGADKVNRHLERAGLSAAAIHGNKSQSQRARTLQAFRSGQVVILVATDIAARGIDVAGVSHVFNYELPNIPEAYVHRIGRTARAGRGGFAISLCDNSERGLLRDIERLTGMALAADRPEDRPRPVAARVRKAPASGTRPAGPGPRPDVRGRPKRGRRKGAACKPESRPDPRKAPEADSAGLTRMLANTGH